MKIAVISDLHIGVEARSRDLQPEGASEKELRESGFLDHFRDFVNSANLDADYLIVPGDISNFGQPTEFDKAHQVVDFVRDALSVSPTNVLCVPGNHDVDWTVIQETPRHPVRLAQRYDGIKNTGLLFSRSFARGDGDLFSEPYFTVWDSDDLFVLAYNSAWHDGPEQLHNGAVEHAHIEAMRKRLTRLKPSPEKPRLFLIHHHLEQYAYMWPGGADISVLANAVPLLELLCEFRFDLLVHGHRHIPHFDTISRSDNHRLVTLCAGSFCRKIDTALASSVANLFHLISLEGRDADTKLCLGSVRSWSFSPIGGWQESYLQDENPNPLRRRGTGIQHTHRFGKYLSPDKLSSSIASLIANQFSGKAIIRWSNICKLEPSLGYQSRKSIEQAIREVAGNLGFSMMTQQDDYVLIKEE